MAVFGRALRCKSGSRRRLGQSIERWTLHARLPASPVLLGILSSLSLVRPDDCLLEAGPLSASRRAGTAGMYGTVDRSCDHLQVRSSSASGNREVALGPVGVV